MVNRCAVGFAVPGVAGFAVTVTDKAWRRSAPAACPHHWTQVRGQAHPNGRRKVHPKGTKGDILVLPLLDAGPNDFLG